MHLASLRPFHTPQNGSRAPSSVWVRYVRARYLGANSTFRYWGSVVIIYDLTSELGRVRRKEELTWEDHRVRISTVWPPEPANQSTTSSPSDPALSGCIPMGVNSKLTKITGLENAYHGDNQVNPPWPLCRHGRNQPRAKRVSLPPILPSVESALRQEEYRESDDRGGYYSPQWHVYVSLLRSNAEKTNETGVAGHLPAE